MFPGSTSQRISFARILLSATDEGILRYPSRGSELLKDSFRFGIWVNSGAKEACCKLI